MLSEICHVGCHFQETWRNKTIPDEKKLIFLHQAQNSFLAPWDPFMDFLSVWYKKWERVFIFYVRNSSLLLFTCKVIHKLIVCFNVRLHHIPFNRSDTREGHILEYMRDCCFKIKTFQYLYSSHYYSVLILNSEFIRFRCIHT